MSQNSLVLPTSGTLSGLQAVTDINAALDTLNTKWSGASVPGSAEFGQTWLDTGTAPATLRLYDGAQWVAVGTLDGTNHVWTPALATVASLAADAVLTAADVGKTFASGAANITVTLPPLASVPDGAEFGFQCQNPTFTVAANGSEKLYGPNWWGVASLGLGQQGAAIKVKKEGATGWLVTSTVFPFATAADVQSGSKSDLMVSPAALSGAILGSPLQSMQDVTASRAANVVYTNSTGRPIVVTIGAYTQSTGEWTISVNGKNCGDGGGSGAYFRSSITVVVPTGGAYELILQSGTVSVSDWTEFR